MRKRIVLASLFTSLAAAASQPMYPNPGALAAKIAEANAMHPMMQAAKAAETQLDVIDILIAFDTSSVRWLAANGKGTPVEYAAHCIKKMNYCLEQSQLIDKFHFRLAGTVEVGEDASQMSLMDIVLGMVNEYGDVVADGEWKKVTDKRAAVGADIVTVMAASGSLGNVGQGFSLDASDGRTPAAIRGFSNWAYNACAIESVDSSYTQLHEVGHNMGCGHPDAAMAPGLAAMSTPTVKMTGPQLFDYSSGWYMWVAGTGYYTIMGYNWGGIGPNGKYSDTLRFQPLPFFSTPAFTWDGHALGDAVHDNRRTMLETYKYVAQFRISQQPPDNPNPPSPNPPVVTDPDPDLPELTFPADQMGVAPVMPPEVVAGLSLAKAAEVGGCLLDANCRPTAAVSFKIGKAGKKGTKVSASVTPFDTGKKITLKAVTIDLSQRPRTLSLEAKNLGVMSVKLGRDAAGKVAFSGVFDGKAVCSAAVADGSTTGVKTFSKPDIPAVVKGVEVNADYLPNDEPVEMQGKKWVLAKAASIAYKKDKATGLKRWFVNNDKNDPKKTNLSALKLTFKAKDGSFKGSFTIYGLQNDKLKKVKADVRGVAVDGKGFGVAVVKGEAPWPITVK